MRLRAFIVGLQDRAARLLGLALEQRTPIVHGMLHRPSGDAAGYWLQLLIAAALATLGLALDSTAVVIGAMLIAPLMRPIVELAMGLATGSAPLVFRTGFRVITSIAVVVLASAAFTWLLPFHEPTRELLARTAPSLLDLVVAAACALAGAYAVVVTSSEVATTAAGTSIGISLVPPLCTVGYGLSVRDWEMAQGAALLFTANATGIITVSGVVFVLTGFGQVDIRKEERSLDANARVGAATRLGRQLSSRTASRVGPISRVVLPAMLLGAIAIPLQRAVGEMSQRSAIRQDIAELLKQGRVVQYSLDQTARPLALRVVVVGDPASAHTLELRLRDRLRSLGASEARVAVWAVPDATALTALSARVDDLPAVSAPPLVVAPPLPLAARVRAAWPKAGTGELLAIWSREGETPSIRVVHLGPELGPVGRELLSRMVSDGDVIPTIEEESLVAVEAPLAEVGAWLAEAARLVEQSRTLLKVQLCLEVPASPTGRREPEPVKLAREVVSRAFAGHPRVVRSEGARWRIVPTTGTCESEADAESR